MNKNIDYRTRNKLIIHYCLGNWTQASVARLFGISRERVSQILDKKNVKIPLTPLQIAQKEWRQKANASFGKYPTSYENL